jgi:hypothetical protein
MAGNSDIVRNMLPPEVSGVEAPSASLNPYETSGGEVAPRAAGHKRGRPPSGSGEPTHFCPACDSAYFSNTGLYLHKKEHHPELLEGSRRLNATNATANFFCEEVGCEKGFVTYGGLYQHKRAHHPWLIQSRAEPTTTISNDGTAKRPRGRPRESDRDVADLKYECPACDKAYASYGGLYQHKRAHHPELR